MQMDEKSAKSLRNYFYEYVIIGLCISVIMLFYMNKTTNDYIRDRLTDELLRNEHIIEQNSAIIQSIH